MNNKKSLVCLSVIMILIFHLYIPVFSFSAGMFRCEKFIRYICYVGVDIFFFVSGFSMGGTRKIEYIDFIKNRTANIYLKFLAFTIFAAVSKKFSVARTLKILLAAELFEKGGGSFLWFLPAIMILYILVPFYKRLDVKYPAAVPCITGSVWIIVSVLISLLTNYKSVFIFTNRLPVFFIGFYFVRYEIPFKLMQKKIIYFVIALLLFISGNIISYAVYANHVTLNFLCDANYILNLPLVLGIILLADRIPDNVFSRTVGGVSLELYALQMIFGFSLANKILGSVKIPAVANIVIFSLLLVCAICCNLVFKIIYRLVAEILKSENR